jgi:hypothetical protein
VPTRFSGALQLGQGLHSRHILGQAHGRGLLQQGARLDQSLANGRQRQSLPVWRLLCHVIIQYLYVFMITIAVWYVRLMDLFYLKIEMND